MYSRFTRTSLIIAFPVFLTGQWVIYSLGLYLLPVFIQRANDPWERAWQHLLSGLLASALTWAITAYPLRSTYGRATSTVAAILCVPNIAITLPVLFRHIGVPSNIYAIAVLSVLTFPLCALVSLGFVGRRMQRSNVTDEKVASPQSRSP